ncbi:dehydrogenase [Corynebacterium sp. 13CS0277]|uniref:nitroreductase family protein n=1 Tax=Corynebacterium sp. 13CS0277 TaxID=2071994 RepID=UPI000D0412C4|nr:nitroreductase family protein [Corynebacterium sp. 13CS0277]PRQ11419.1 dehydrogenase [Corynebacterium sp. 13CS0277]
MTNSAPTAAAAEFHSAVKGRRAIREYADQPIAADVLDRVVDAALEAPSAFNLQLRDVVVVRDAETKNKLTETSGQPQFAAADTVLIFVARTEAIPEDASEILPESYLERVAGMKADLPADVLREMAMKDAMLAAGFGLMAAAMEGLATSPTTGWNEETVKELIGLGGREDRGIALVVAMGHPTEAAADAAHPGRQASRRVNERYSA